MKSVLDDLRPEPWSKVWEKFDIKGIVHKEFVAPGWTVNGKFCCDVLRRLRENIRPKLPDKWRDNSWALSHNNAPAHALLIVQQFLASTNTTVILQPPYSLDPTPYVFFPIPNYEIETQGAMFWEHWGDPDWITERDEDAEAKWLPEVLPITKIPLELLYECQRGLLRTGQWWIKISVSG